MTTISLRCFTNRRVRKPTINNKCEAHSARSSQKARKLSGGVLDSRNFFVYVGDKTHKDTLVRAYSQKIRARSTESARTPPYTLHATTELALSNLHVHAFLQKALILAPRFAKNALNFTVKSPFKISLGKPRRISLAET